MNGGARPRLLDLFCGAGGCSMGYHRAGFEVVGVDLEPQLRYPFEFHKADAMTFPLDGFDAIHASPPCDDHSPLANVNAAKGTAWMLAAILERFAALDMPWVVENVEMADMPGSVTLCGSEFGLKARMDDGREVWLKRHRKFRSNVFLWGAGGCNCHGKPTIGVYGGGAGGPRQGAGRGKGAARAAREVMRIGWMNRDELDRAIPPAYTEFIGGQLREHLVRMLNPVPLDPGGLVNREFDEQSTTACCPRQTIPDSCSCLEDCECMCLDCICEGWGDDGEWSSGPSLVELDAYGDFAPERKRP